MTKHEHHRMMVVFIVVAVLIIIVLLGFYLYQTPSSTQPTTAPVVDQRSQTIADSIAALKGISPATQADIQASLKQIPKSAKPASQAEINQTLNQLKKLNLQ